MAMTIIFPYILNFSPKLIHYFPNTIDSKDHASHCPLVSPLSCIECPCFHLGHYVFLKPLFYLVGLNSMLQYYLTVLITL